MYNVITYIIYIILSCASPKKKIYILISYDYIVYIIFSCASQ